ncbi:MAG: YafY family transcriptional regulator [Anaerolineales bacterium]|nr:YafY family transcriptional regulator [Anaerolineales bacterium]
MRADRLLSILMLLQSRRQMTAQELAAELEVSERTIYRDVIALSTAGVPIYTEKGPGGGIALIDSYRTNLTGLTKDEVRALFMLSVPEALDELGLSQELRTALLKLSAALPTGLRQDETQVRQRVYIDTAWWNAPKISVPHLSVIQQAVWEDRNLRVSMQFQFGANLEHIVDPYGLVAKAGAWYLVWHKAGQVGVHRIADLVEVHLLDEHFERDPDFDLTGYWKEWAAGETQRRGDYAVRARVMAGLPRHVSYQFHPQIRAQLKDAIPDEDGWATLTLHYEHFFEARGHLLALGGAVEVLKPEPLRLSIADHARQIVKVYGGETGN